MTFFDDRPGNPKKTLFILDISSFIFRAFFAIRELRNSKGEPTNAVYGVATMLSRVLDESGAEHFVVAYDSKEPSFRKTLFAEYKANRSEPPEDLKPQFNRIEQMITALKLPSVRGGGLEADDWIASLDGYWKKLDPENRVVVVSGDKDLMQLVDERTLMWDTMKDIVYDAKKVEEKFCVPPTKIRDYLSLIGDTSDNIPGVTGIGPKGACDLLREFGDLTAILAAAVAGKISGKKGTLIAEQIEKAKLSYELVKLNRDCALNFTVEQLTVAKNAHGQIDFDPSFLNLLDELELKSLKQKWVSRSFYAEVPIGEPVGAGAPASIPVVAPPEWVCVDTVEKWNAFFAGLKSAPTFGFDTETTSLDPHLARCVGFSFCYSGDQSFYIPVGHAQPGLDLNFVVSGLREIFNDPQKELTAHNLKYDLAILKGLDIYPKNQCVDTMVADYNLSPETKHSLADVAKRVLNYEVTSFESICGKGKDQITFDQVPLDVATRYSAEDAWVTYTAWKFQKDQLSEAALFPVFASVDMPLVPVLMDMQWDGVLIDELYLNKLGDEFKIELRRAETEVLKFTDKPLNLNSPKQLAEFLFVDLGLPTQSKTKTGFSTDASVLEALSHLHEAPRRLLEVRELSKLLSTYIDPLPGLKNPKTGRIHAHFNQAVAQTGRLSSSDPNLQNIPIRSERGEKIRKAFISGPGNVLICADYSQIELRLLAEMSGDPVLSDAFLNNRDVHRQTGAEIFSKREDAVTESERDIAKAINFGLMYGKSAFGLAEELGLSRGDAKALIDRYFTRYSGVKRYLDSLIGIATEKGYSETLLGRRRYLPGIHSKNHAVKNHYARMAMNAPIQGTAADLMKLAMTRVHRALSDGARLLMTVHDEVIVEASVDQVAANVVKVRDALENAFDGWVKMKVPLVCNVTTGPSWMEQRRWE